MNSKIIFVIWSMFFSLAVWAGQEEATAALTEILFDNDMENISYVVDGRGDVDITFGVAVTDDIYIDILSQIRKHPDIPSVLASKGHVNFCAQR